MVHSFSVRTRQHSEFVNIDAQVQAIVSEAGLEEGVAVVYVPHTTAGITINENADPDVVRDMLMILDRMVPWEGGYAHGEGNSAAHVKASTVGFSQTIIVSGGTLQFGTWQSIYFCEFDGPRNRTVWVRLLAEAT